MKKIGKHILTSIVGLIALPVAILFLLLIGFNICIAWITQGVGWLLEKFFTGSATVIENYVKRFGSK